MGMSNDLSFIAHFQHDAEQQIERLVCILNIFWASYSDSL